MELTPEKIAEELLKRGHDYADKEAAASVLEETKHTVLAECMADWPEDSNAGAETKARRDPRYKNHINNMVEARRQANRAKVAYETMKAYEGLYRTRESTKRAEMQIR